MFEGVFARGDVLWVLVHHEGLVAEVLYSQPTVCLAVFMADYPVHIFVAVDNQVNTAAGLHYTCHARPGPFVTRPLIINYSGHALGLLERVERVAFTQAVLILQVLATTWSFKCWRTQMFVTTLCSRLCSLVHGIVQWRIKTAHCHYKVWTLYLWHGDLYQVIRLLRPVARISRPCDRAVTLMRRMV